MEIAQTNDKHRNRLSQKDWLKGTRVNITLTSGVATGQQPIDDILSAVASFDDFDKETDPDNEHVFGKIDVNGVLMVWKMEYLSNHLFSPSPDKTDISKTIRMITIMTNEEFLKTSLR